MRIVSTNVYVGPNQYALYPVIRHTVHLGVLEDFPTGSLPGLVDGLLQALPGLSDHGCSYREPGGFVRRMREDEGTWIGHVWEHLVLELQCVAGNEVSFGKTRSTHRARGEYDMIFQYQHREVGLEAARLGLRLIRHNLPEGLRADFPESSQGPLDWEGELEAFIRRAQRHSFGPSTRALVQAAEERGIPWLRLNRQSLVQFGHGKHQRRTLATMTSETRHVPVEIASDKADTRDLLAGLGLPVPRQELVYDAVEAAGAAERIGYPVVVKPLNANHGRGVSIKLTRPEQIEDAFRVAHRHATSHGVLVESFVPGCDHRMLVVDGRLVAVAKRVPGHVMGDGVHTIRELTEIANRDPRRGVGHEKELTRLELDEQAEWLMRGAGLGPESVLPNGRRFFLRSTANLSTGGTAIDMTDVAHPDNCDLAIRAVKAVGLDVGGVDFLTEDITRSYLDVGGAIVEVNASPGLRMHLSPSEGRPRPVADPIIEMMFPPGTRSRIPIVAITGTNGKTTTTRMVAHILQVNGYSPGSTSTDGVYITGRRVFRGDMTGPAGAQMVLRYPDVDSAVLEVARGGLVRAGLGFPRCDVAACINVTSDHLGFGRIETLEELAAIKEIPILVAEDTAVLNADDPLVMGMGGETRARHICFVTMDPAHPEVRAHIRRGGRAVVLEESRMGETITLYDGQRHLPLVSTDRIPATLEGRAAHNIQNAMFAAGIAYALGTRAVSLTLDQIRYGLQTFSNAFHDAPGRLNVFDGHPFKVILDYAHNPAAAEAMGRLVERMKVAGRRILVLSAPGNRRNEDFEEMARAIASRFDQFVLKQDAQLRGRRDGEVPGLLKGFLLGAGVSRSAIRTIPDEGAAIRGAMEVAGAGDLIVIFGEDPGRCWEQIVHFRPAPVTNGAGPRSAAEREGDGSAPVRADPPARLSRRRAPRRGPGERGARTGSESDGG